MTARVRKILATLPPDRRTAAVISSLQQWLTRQNDVQAEELFAKADVGIAALGRTLPGKAAVEHWLGMVCTLLRLPAPYLARIGSTPRPWESELTPLMRARLWTERSNALRLMRRIPEALECIEDALRELPLDAPAEWRRVAIRNQAIMLREIGDPDTAIRVLDSILPETSGAERVSMLESVVVTEVELGRDESALAHASEAVTLSAQHALDLDARVRASYATLLIRYASYDEAVSVLKTVGLYADPLALTAAAAAWANLARSRPESVDLEIVSSLRASLASAAERAAADADVLGLLMLLSAEGSLAESLGEDPIPVLQRAYDESLQYDTFVLPWIPCMLANAAYKRGDVSSARLFVAEIVSMVVAQSGLVLDIEGASIAQGRSLRSKLRQLTATVIDGALDPDSAVVAEDLRLVAEVSRDVLGRAQMLRGITFESTNRDVPYFGIEKEAAAALAPTSGHVVVLEWIDDGERYATIASLIAADGSTSIDTLAPPPVPLERLAKALEARLSAWLPSYDGEPFEVEGVRELQRWLDDELQSRISLGDHVVFIEHPQHAGIPWHVFARRWSCSYAASWTSMLRARASPRGRSRAFGVAVVPRAREGPTVARALVESRTRSENVAERCGVPLWAEEGVGCDRSALRSMLTGTFATKLLCHGFVDPVSREVAVMIAHAGELPRNDIPTSDPRHRAFRFGWRDCLDLAGAPEIIYSAACSSGGSHLVELGERLGFFSGLRLRGTRAVVAPRWDIAPHHVLPILDDVVARVQAGKGLGVALHEACACTSSTTPLWLAWSLSLEGDWT